MRFRLVAIALLAVCASAERADTVQATGNVTLPADLGWRPLIVAKSLAGWQPRGECQWSVLPDGTLLGKRTGAVNSQAWLYTAAEYGEFDLHLEYWIPAGGNSGVSIRDRSRAAAAIGETQPYTTPAHIGYEIQIIDDDAETYPTGSVYLFAAAKTGAHRPGQWNSLDIESRNALIRVRVNGRVVAESPGDPARSKVGPIGLQLHDRFTVALFRNLRLRPASEPRP
jgi:hypothetical protein